MSLMPGYEDGVYFNDDELDGIGWIVADNLSHTYRSQGADFRLVDVQHGYNFDKNEYIISVTCQCASHYDPEVFSRKEYGPYLDSVDGQDFTATRTFQYNRFDTHNTMGKSLAIDLTEDIENQIRAGVKKFNGGVTASHRIKASSKVVASNYDTKIIAKYLKKKFDDEAFGTSHSSSLGSFYRNNPNDPDIYMNRNGLRYDSRNNTITDRDDTPVFKVIPQYSHPKRQGVYPPKLPKIVPIDEWNATHNVEGCDKVTCSSDTGRDEGVVKFYYKHKLLGECEPEFMECEALLDVMQRDSELSSLILNYMNSLGDPVFPVSEEDWGTPETDINNIDIEDLYDTFMQELQYDYNDFPDDFYVEISEPRSVKLGLEIFIEDK